MVFRAIIKKALISLLLIATLVHLGTSQEPAVNQQTISYQEPSLKNSTEQPKTLQNRKVLLDNLNVHQFNDTTKTDPQEKTQGSVQGQERALPTYSYYNYYYGVIYYSSYSYNYYYSKYTSRYSSKYTYSGYSYYSYLSYLSYYSYYYYYSRYTYSSYTSSYKSSSSSSSYNKRYSKSSDDFDFVYFPAVFVPTFLTFFFSLMIGCCAIPLCCKTRFRKGIMQTCLCRKATKKCKCCKRKKPLYKRHHSEYQRAIEKGLVSGTSQPHVVPTMAPYYASSHPTAMPMQQPYQPYGQQTVPYTQAQYPGQPPYHPMEQPGQQPYYPMQQPGMQQYQPIMQPGVAAGFPGNQAQTYQVQPLMDAQPQQPMAFTGQPVYYQNPAHVQQPISHGEQIGQTHATDQSMIGNLNEHMPLHSNQSPDVKDKRLL